MAELTSEQTEAAKRLTADSWDVYWPQESPQSEDKWFRLCDEITADGRVVADALLALARDHEALRQRLGEIWQRVAGFAVCESCGPENRYRITIDYRTLEKAQDAYRAMHELTAALEQKGG